MGSSSGCWQIRHWVHRKDSLREHYCCCPQTQRDSRYCSYSSWTQKDSVSGQAGWPDQRHCLEHSVATAARMMGRQRGWVSRQGLMSGQKPKLAVTPGQTLKLVAKAVQTLGLAVMAVQRPTLPAPTVMVDQKLILLVQAAMVDQRRCPGYSAVTVGRKTARQKDSALRRVLKVAQKHFAQLKRRLRRARKYSRSQGNSGYGVGR